MPSDKYLEIYSDSFPYIFMKHKDIPLKTYDISILRYDIYLPKDGAPLAVKDIPSLRLTALVRGSVQNSPREFFRILTYCADRKDVPYKIFSPKSWIQLSHAMTSDHSSWETPDPGYWTSQGYIIIRGDDCGAGQSPGELDTMSRGSSEAFFDVVEWCVDQEWSSRKVGLLGISYYDGTKWRVAARRQKGLAAIIPWEGMSDYHRDRVRHGDILSDKFIKFWWENAVEKNQYGKPGRAAQGWGFDTLDGDLDEATLIANRRNQMEDTEKHRYLDEEYFSSRNFDVQDIEVPLLSVANWGGILLHLRGNVLGWMRASSQHKFLHFIVGRHDLPFYYDHSAKLQKSFLDAFLKGDDYDGWKTGHQPRVRLTLRQGDCGVDDPLRELSFPTRGEDDWPLPDTRYTKFFLTAENELSETAKDVKRVFSYDALSGEPLQFRYTADTTVELTGDVLANLSVSIDRKDENVPRDMDLFLALRKLAKDGSEVFYTVTIGDPVPLVEGWHRVSLYCASDVQEVKAGVIYEVEVEIWPTKVVLEDRETLVLEVAGHDAQGAGIFSHSDSEDQKTKHMDGANNVHVGNKDSWLLLPTIPDRR
ncbi:X-Pro dipeptidyl-peptidase protein [Curvularia clavata]|uniref:X-Pro dipeptidyl-peptidase protein n=1 Tax=Curvularia clavata TaxID=95742 RepID=A0A9Q8ZII1_CURCL|nr:X-Pro dipeptidyl-peptidase protein [Curvularia clavata]